MGDRRRGSYGNLEQRWSGNPPRHVRPPRPQGASYPSNPSWEKKFVTKKCKIPWWKVDQIKNMMYVYKNVIEWDDLGARETLQNAKSRYWAESNGLPCDIPLPDPNMFIDEVDYDAVVDPELIAALGEKPPKPVDDDVDYCCVPLDGPIVPTGWGDEEDAHSDQSKDPAERLIANWNNNVNMHIIPTGWGDAEDPHPSTGGIPTDFNDAWNTNGWGNSRDNGRNNSLGTSYRNTVSTRRNCRRREWR